MKQSQLVYADELDLNIKDTEKKPINNQTEAVLKNTERRVGKRRLRRNARGLVDNIGSTFVDNFEPSSEEIPTRLPS